MEGGGPLIRVVQESAASTSVSLIRKNPASENSSKKGNRRTLGTTEGDDVDAILSSLQNTCPFCQKVFDDGEKVETHVKRIHRIPHKCDKCFQGFHTKEGLELHRAKHREKRVYECEICHMKWVQEKSLMFHKLRSHSTQTAEYICEHCGKTFHVERDLDYHIKRNHLKESDEPAFEVCQYCGKQVKSIRGHEWLHHKEIVKQKKRFPCHLCKKRFCDQVRLDRHLVRHSNGIKCEDCGKEYPGRQELTNHRRRKHGQGTYLTCVVCQKTFAIGYYYLHVLTHAGIRPYKCDICEENFTQRTTLLRHRKQHPGPLPPEPPSNPHIVYLAKKYLQELQESQVDEDSVASELA